MRNLGEVTLEDVRVAKEMLTHHQWRVEEINRLIADVTNGQLHFEDGGADVTRDKLSELRQVRRELAPIYRRLHDDYVRQLRKYAERHLKGFTAGDRRAALAAAKREMRGLEPTAAKTGKPSRSAEA